jgi:hypothetical protein
MRLSCACAGFDPDKTEAFLPARLISPIVLYRLTVCEQYCRKTKWNANPNPRIAPTLRAHRGPIDQRLEPQLHLRGLQSSEATHTIRSNLNSIFYVFLICRLCTGRCICSPFQRFSFFAFSFFRFSFLGFRIRHVSAWAPVSLSAAQQAFIHFLRTCSCCIVCILQHGDFPFVSYDERDGEVLF